MEKKSVVVTPRGYTIKVSDHMLGDLAKFGVTKNKPTLKPVPKELLNLQGKQIKTEVLPEMKSSAPVEPIVVPETSGQVTEVAEPKARKTAVRSKSKK